MSKLESLSRFLQKFTFEFYTCSWMAGFYFCRLPLRQLLISNLSFLPQESTFWAFILKLIFSSLLFALSRILSINTSSSKIVDKSLGLYIKLYYFPWPEGVEVFAATPEFSINSLLKVYICDFSYAFSLLSLKSSSAIFFYWSFVSKFGELAKFFEAKLLELFYEDCLSKKSV